ncbi:MAG: cyclic pyranopterin monophosphate synthase MoaC [Candidatus Aminicenantia bacterium]
MIKMIDISAKEIIKRKAVASGIIYLKKTTIEKIKKGQIKKGNPLVVAEIAAINAVKNTHFLIPLCHPIQLEEIKTEFQIEEELIVARTLVTATAKTGVEMEALVGVTAALNTIWDMVKYLEKDDKGQYPTTKIGEIKVIEKTKQESEFKPEVMLKDTTKEHKSKAPQRVKVAVLTLSTTRTLDNDKTGDLIEQILEANHHQVLIRKVVPEEKEKIIEVLEDILENKNIQAIITNGGTGLSKEDITVETIKSRFEKEITGFNSLFISLGHEQIGSAAMLSRACAGLIKEKVIFCLPGSARACQLALEKLILPEIGHILKHGGE